MKKLLLPLVVLALAGCAAVPQKPVAQTQTVVRPHFDVDTFALIAVQYHAPRTIAGVNLYGPVPKEAQCQQGGAAFLSQSSQYMPKEDRAASTCLEVKFTGPVATGQTVMQPFSGAPVAYAIVPIEYDGNGKYLGMGVGDEPRQAIPGGQTAAECKARADDIRTSSYANGKVASTASLIVYCVGLPELPAEVWRGGSDDSSVMDKPCPSFPFVGAGPCQIAVAQWGDYVVQIHNGWAVRVIGDNQLQEAERLQAFIDSQETTPERVADWIDARLNYAPDRLAIWMDAHL